MLLVIQIKTNTHHTLLQTSNIDTLGGETTQNWVNCNLAGYKFSECPTISRHSSTWFNHLASCAPLSHVPPILFFQLERHCGYSGFAIE